MERGPHSGSRTRAWRREGSVREHDRQAHDHVLDAAVAARLLARRPRSAQPSDGRPRKGAREVAEREAKLVEVLLESHAVDAGLAPAGEVGLVDLEDAIECAHVDDELIGFRRQGTANTASSAERRDRDSVRGSPPEDGGDLLSAGGSNYQNAWRGAAGALFHDRHRPQIAHRSLIEGGGAHDFLELFSHWPAFALHRPASQPVRIGTPKPQGPA